MPIIPVEQSKPYKSSSLSDSDVYSKIDEHPHEYWYETVNRHGEALVANFEENLVTSKLAVSAFQKAEELAEDISLWREGEKKDPNFNPFEYIQGYESYALDFADCDTLGDVHRTMKRIDAENRNYAKMGDVPAGANFFYGMTSGFLDPVNLIPFGGAVLKSNTALNGAISGAVSSFGANAVQEAIIKNMSYNYTEDEYAQNVLIGSVFGGALGAVKGGLTHLADKIQYEKAIKENIDIVRKNTFDDKFLEKKGTIMKEMDDTPVEKRLDNILSEESDSSAGAKEVSGVATEVDSDNFLARSLIKAEQKINPVMRLATSLSKKTRELANNLFEMPFYTKNVQDAYNIESMNKKSLDLISFLDNDIKENYKKYYFDKENVGFTEEVKVTFGKTKQGKMTLKEFNSAVTENIKYGKHADNPYIVDSANKWRAIANEQMKRIQKLHDEGVIDLYAVDENWVPAMFDKDIVTRDTSGFIDAMAQKLKTFADELRRTDEVVNKNKQLESTKVNVEKLKTETYGPVDEISGKREKGIAKEIEKLSGKNYFIEKDIVSLGGQEKTAYRNMKKAERALNKSRERLFKQDKSVDVSFDKDFAHDIKHGLRKDLKPKSLTQELRDNGYLIDDPDNLLLSDSKLRLQNHKGRKPSNAEIIKLDDLGQRLWEEGWYKERPYVADLVEDLINDEKGFKPMYSESARNALNREYNIDMARETLRNAGYNYEDLSVEQIDNLLITLGDKNYIRKAYVDKARSQEMERDVFGKQKAFDEAKEYYENILERKKEKEASFAENKQELDSQRQLRDINKENIRKGERLIKDLEKKLEWEEKLLQLTDDDFKQYGREIADEILGVKDVIKSYDNIKISERGSMKSRDFLTGDISMLEPFMVQDITRLSSALRREMIDLNLIEKFGSVGLDEQKFQINNEYDILRNKLEEEANKLSDNSKEKLKVQKKILALDKERKADLDSITTSVDRMRGTEYAKHKVGDTTSTVLDVAKTYNVLTSLGRVTVSSISDLSGAVLKTDIQSALPALKIFKNTFNADLVKKLREVPELAHAITELFSNVRENSFAEMASDNPFESNFMKKTRAYTDVYMHVNGLSRWNALGKSFAGLSYMNKVYGLGEKLSLGKALSDSDMKWLKLYGYSKDEILEIFENYNKYGNVSQNQKYANSAMWENKALADKFVSGINKIMDTAVVTPGAEKMKAFDNPYLSVMLQFKQFIFSSMSRTTIPALQNARDYNTVMAISFAWILGCMSILAKDALSGKDDRTPGDYITSGFAQSGIAAWTELPYSVINASTRGGLDKLFYKTTGGYFGSKGMTPVESDRELFQLLGPTFGKVKNVTSLVGDFSEGKYKKSTAYKIKSIIPFQNTIYLDWILKTILTAWSNK